MKLEKNLANICGLLKPRFLLLLFGTDFADFFFRIQNVTFSFSMRFYPFETKTVESPVKIGEERFIL